jgi:hypothetical protein
MTVTPYELLIPAAGLRWLNANDRMFWMKKSRIVRAWRQRAQFVASSSRIPRLIPYARVVAELQFGDSRRRDPANWAPTVKACIDGLVDAEIFEDDNFRHVVGPDLRLGEKVVAANVGVRLIITPITLERAP